MLLLVAADDSYLVDRLFVLVVRDSTLNYEFGSQEFQARVLDENTKTYTWYGLYV